MSFLKRTKSWKVYNYWLSEAHFLGGDMRGEEKPPPPRWGGYLCIARCPKMASQCATTHNHATTVNWVCKRTQRRNIQQFCVSLHGRGLSSPRIKTNNSLNRKSVINWGIGKLALLSAKSVLWTSELPLLSRVIQQHLGNCMWCFVYLLQSSTNW